MTSGAADLGCRPRDDAQAYAATMRDDTAYPSGALVGGRFRTADQRPHEVAARWALDPGRLP
jgi:hypothetical protein